MTWRSPRGLALRIAALTLCAVWVGTSWLLAPALLALALIALTDRGPAHPVTALCTLGLALLLAAHPGLGPRLEPVATMATGAGSLREVGPHHPLLRAALVALLAATAAALLRAARGHRVPVVAAFALSAPGLLIALGSAKVIQTGGGPPVGGAIVAATLAILGRGTACAALGTLACVEQPTRLGRLGVGGLFVQVLGEAGVCLEAIDRRMPTADAYYVVAVELTTLVALLTLAAIAIRDLLDRAAPIRHNDGPRAHVVAAAEATGSGAR